jgi:predicted HTH transcriptional regulator
MKYPNEERNIEFKSSISWDDDIRLKIAKSIIALANIQDGGWIVIGKEEQPDRSYIVTGMTQEHFDSFDSDEIKAFLYERTDPPAKFDVYKKEIEGKKHVFIKVKEFESEPIICKKDCGDILHRGVIYVRSKGKPESIAVPTHIEMKEMIDLAIDKGVIKFLERTRRVGIVLPPPANDNESFEKQIEELK